MPAVVAITSSGGSSRAKEQAAARLGHADSGQLLDRIYDVGDRRARMRKAIDALASDGLRGGARRADPAAVE